MAEEIQAEIHAPDLSANYIFQGQLQTTRAFVQYMIHLFTNMPFLSEFKWITDQKLTGVTIYTRFPHKAIKYPAIRIVATFIRNMLTGFRDISKFLEPEEDATKGSLVFSGVHLYRVTFTFNDYSRERLHDLMDRVMLLLSYDGVRQKIFQTYGLLIDAPEGVTSSELIEKNIEGSDQKEWEGTLSIVVHNQWEISFSEQDYEIINSEVVYSDSL